MRNRKKYPKNWPELARKCKEQAGWKCEECYIPHGTLRRSKHTGNLYQVRLQAAHADHDPHNENPRLVAVCPYCHWHFYRKHDQLPRWYIEKLRHRQLLKAKGYLVGV